MSDVPLDGYTLKGRIESLAKEGTVYKRLGALSSIKRPLIHEVGRAKSRRGKTDRILYDLTIRGGITALFLLNEEPDGDLKKYAKRFGWGSTDRTLQSVHRLAEEPRFWPIAKPILLYLKHEPLLFHSLEDADDAGLLQVMEKDVFRIAVNNLRSDRNLSGLVEEADRALAARGLRSLEHP